MDAGLKRKVAVGVVAGLAVVGAGGAVAASQLGSPKEESQAIVSDAARELGVEPSALSDALKKALANRIDASVEAGRLTKEQGDALKERIQSGELPLFGVGHGFGHHGHFGDLDAAATYLGLTEAELRSELAAGKTLAQVARDRDKSVDALIDALVEAAKNKLDDAVAAGRLTDAQRDRMVENLEERVTAFVNGTGGPRFGLHRARGFDGAPPGGGFFGPPAF